MTLFFPTLRNSPKAAFAATFVLAVLLIALPFIVGTMGNAWVRALAFAALYVMLAMGLNIVVGFAGLLDLGYIAFYAVGAYTYALLASPHLTSNFPALAAMFPDGFHSSIWMVIPMAAAVAGFFGVVLGAPVLKLRGDYLAIVTLGFGEIIRIFLNNLNAPLNFTNGPQGITLIEPVRILGVDLSKTQSLFGISLPSVHLYYYLFLFLTDHHDHCVHPAAGLAPRPRLDGDPRRRRRCEGDGHQRAQHQAARLCAGRDLRWRVRHRCSPRSRASCRRSRSH